MTCNNNVLWLSFKPGIEPRERLAWAPWLGDSKKRKVAKQPKPSFTIPANIGCRWVQWPKPCNTDWSHWPDVVQNVGSPIVVRGRGCNTLAKRWQIRTADERTGGESKTGQYARVWSNRVGRGYSRRSPRGPPQGLLKPRIWPGRGKGDTHKRGNMGVGDATLRICLQNHRKQQAECWGQTLTL
jgi:hypothetical protein